MAYKRKIAYFDYIEDGQKKGSKGFCKWEQRNDRHVVIVSLSGLPNGIAEKTGVCTKAGDVLGELKLRDGRAEAVYRLEEDGHDWCRELTRIRIPLSQGRELEAVFPAEGDYVDESGEQTQTKGEQKRIESVDIKVLKPETEKEEMPHLENTELVRDEQIEEVESVETPDMMPEEKEPPLHSLWMVLANEHETIHPFGTETECYRLKIEDINLLKKRYHILRNNPFLLHGYYNYKYLIIGKKDEVSEEYWLGVPGIYHDREKMAARMYGFEKFEGAKSRYGVGDLGYYLITVE